MKRNIAKAFTAVLVTAAAAFALFACDDGQTTPVTYSVTYVSNAADATGTAPAAAQKAEGDKFTLASNPFTYEGFTFDGWRYNETTYQAGAEFTMPAANVEFKAVWKADGPTEYAVTYAKGEGEVTGDLPEAVRKAEGAKFELPAVGNLANEGYAFVGWSDGETVYAAGAEYTMPAKAVTFTALWKLTTYGIADMVGVYAGDGMTLTVSDVAYTGMQQEGMYFVVIDEKKPGFIAQMRFNNEMCWGMNSWDMEGYLLDFDSSRNAIVLTVLEYDESAEEMVATDTAYTLNKTADYELSEATDFAGRYTTEVPAAQEGEPAVQMMWLINADGTAVYQNRATAVTYTIVGNFICIYLKDSNLAGVYSESDGNLVGYKCEFNEEQYANIYTEATFTASENVLTLTVDGKLSQLVEKGKAPLSIAVPAAPDSTKEFDKWVLAGTTTEFDPAANMTADASITATFKDKPAPAATKTYVGNCTYTTTGMLGASCTYTSFTIDTAAMTVTYDCTQGTALTSDLTDESNSSYKPSGTDKYYSVSLAHASKLSKKNFYLAISADGNTLTLCDKNDEPIANGTFTSGGGTTPVMPTYNLSMGSTSVNTLQFDNETGKLVVNGTTYTGTAATSYDGDKAWDFSSSNPFGQSQCTLLIYGNTLYVYGAVPSEASIEDPAAYSYDKS